LKKKLEGIIPYIWNRHTRNTLYPELTIGNQNIL